MLTLPSTGRAPNVACHSANSYLTAGGAKLTPCKPIANCRQVSDRGQTSRMQFYSKVLGASCCQVQLHIILARFLNVQTAPCTLELVQPTSRIVVNRRKRATMGPVQCVVKWLHALSERDSVGFRYTSQPRSWGALLSSCNLAIASDHELKHGTHFNHRGMIKQLQS